ncbi:MAG: ABC transporter ATP-binding protein [Pseudomonadota bacterium]
MNDLSVIGLTKRFGNDTVLDGLSFDVPAGGTLVLFGRSGSGKSVLLSCIAGAIDPEEGAIAIGGEDVTSLPPEKRDVGMAFQNFALFPHMSAFDNIASPLTARRSKRAAIKEGVENVAKLLKIDHVLGHQPRALSNGQKQRTSLARALAASPRLLLLDDPLRNVDAKLRFEMRLELPRLLAENDATVVYVTQDYKEAMALGDRIAVLDAGKIVQIGTPEEIYHRPANTGIAQLFGDPSINLLDVVPGRDGEGVFVRLSDQRVALDPGLAAAVGKDCIVGLRPEALRFTDEPHGIPVTIDAETPLNEKTVTLVETLRRREILVSRPAGTPAPSEGETRLMVASADTILFDRASGERIVPEHTAAPANEAAA